MLKYLTKLVHTYISSNIDQIYILLTNFNIGQYFLFTNIQVLS